MAVFTGGEVGVCGVCTGTGVCVETRGFFSGRGRDWLLKWVS